MEPSLLFPRPIFQSHGDFKKIYSRVAASHYSKLLITSDATLVGFETTAKRICICQKVLSHGIELAHISFKLAAATFCTVRWRSLRRLHIVCI